MEEQTLTADPAPAQAATPSAPVEPTVEQPAGTGTPPVEKTAPETTTPEKKEWDGNLETLKDLGKDEVERAKSMRRYLTKKTQELSEAQKKAQEFDKLKSDPRYQQFIAAQNGQPQPQPQPTAAPQPLWTENEWQEAMVNPNKMAELFDRGVQARVMQVAQQYAPYIQELQQKQTFVEKSQEIDEFARVHPDVWDLYDAGIMKPLVQSVVDSGKGTFAEAYEMAKKQEAYYEQRALQKAQGRVQEKKAAVSATPSPTNEASVLWANDREEAKRIAFEQALLGKKVTVKTRS
jgi:hypothetical protein